MIIHKLHLHNFKSIEDHTLDFDDIKGFWEISGVVGSGKTTIGEAILFALFGSVKQKNNTDLISWGEKKALVEVWLESKGFEIYIKRTINHIGQCPISVTIDGKSLDFSNKRNAQSILETDYYDISRLALELLCIISFDGFQSFSRMNAQDTKQFLDQVFGFRILSEYSELCKQEIKQVQSSQQKTTIQIDSTEKQIKKFKDWKDNSGSDNLITQDDIDNANDAQKEAKDKLDKYDRETKTESQQILKDTIALKQKLTEITTLGKQKKNDIDFLKKGICPTCGAKLDQSHLHIHEEERNKLLAEYDDISKEIKAIEAKNKEYENSRINGRKELQDSYLSLYQTFVNIQSDFKHQNDCNIQIDSLTAELQDLEKKQKKFDKDIRDWEELSDIISVDIRQEILKSLIPHINSYIKAYMTILHQPYLVEFSNSFKCSIRIGTIKDNISTSSLSTGQQKIVDMVIILAILKVLLSGVNFSIIVLDELFANLDEELRNEMCKILKKNIKENQTMFVISHAPLSPQYMDGYIKTRIISGKTQLEMVRS